MEINQTIKNVEKKWLKLLFENCRLVFKKVKIPSHDHFHHLRVWYYAKELIVQIQSKQNIFSEPDIENIIIACFFHDTGMSQDKGIKHGNLSSQICAKFFSNNINLTPHNLNIILEAIKNHDDKEYKDILKLDSTSNKILSILCVSDDLDAFGTIGIYRYIEIYYLRGIKLEHFSKEITPNIQKRFDNFCQLFNDFPQFVNTQKERFLITINFFQNLSDLEKIEILYLIIIHSIINDTPVQNIYEIILESNRKTYDYKEESLKFFQKLKIEFKE